MTKTAHLPLRKGELSLLKMWMDDNITWENAGFQIKLKLFTSAYKEEILEEWMIQDFMEKLGVSRNPTRDELIEAMKDHGSEVIEPDKEEVEA